VESSTFDLVPVTPKWETRYIKPEHAATILVNLLFDVDGADRKIVSML